MLHIYEENIISRQHKHTKYISRIFKRSAHSLPLILSILFIYLSNKCLYSRFALYSCLCLFLYIQSYIKVHVLCMFMKKAESIHFFCRCFFPSQTQHKNSNNNSNNSSHIVFIYIYTYSNVRIQVCTAGKETEATNPKSQIKA